MENKGRDDSPNRIQELYDKEFNKAGTNNTANKIDYTNGDSSSEHLGEREEQGSALPGLGNDPTRQVSHKSTVSASNLPINGKAKIGVRLFKKIGPKGAVAGVGVIIAAIIAVFTAIYGPGNVLLSVFSGFVDTNDTTTSAFQRRMMKAFGLAHSQDPICSINTSVNLKCSAGRISNKALYKLENRGFKAIFDDNVYYDGSSSGSKSGYPKKPPVAYEITSADGSSKVRVEVDDLIDFLGKKENSKITARLFGVGGVYNPRFIAFTGKYMIKQYWNKLGISKAGGLASSEYKVLKTFAEKWDLLKSKLPQNASAEAAVNRFKTSIESKMGNVKKAGAAYLTAYASCIAIKAPSFIASSVANIQGMQVTQVTNEVVLSPGDMQKAAGAGSGYDSESAAASGTALTEQVPRDSDGKLSSAVNSPWLLAAMGVNTNPTGLSEQFTPGYSFLANPLVQGFAGISQQTESGCSVIMSEPAMYTAMAADVASTAAMAAASAGVLGVVKVAASWVISDMVASLATHMFTDSVKTAITAAAENPAIPNARGENLGTVLGIGAFRFFSGAAMTRGLPILTKSKLSDAESVHQKAIAERREWDIASLSPFDTSSQYTFLGSIVHNLRLAALANGSYNSNFTSIASNILRLPGTALSLINPKAQAASSALAKQCNNAAALGLDTGSDATTPAINPAAMGCYGITEDQASMDSEYAINTLINAGWLDNSIEVSDGDTLEDLLNKKVIVPDTPMASYLTSCGDASSGDTLINAAGCTLSGYDTVADSGVDKPIYYNKTNGQIVKLAEANLCSGTDPCLPSNSEVSQENLVKIPSRTTLDAVIAFIIDFQLNRSINGEDEEEDADTASSASSSTSTNWAVSADHNGNIDKNSADWIRWEKELGGNGNTDSGALKPITPADSNICSTANSLNKNGGGNLFNPNAAASARALIDAFNSANSGRYLVPGACFRSLVGQQLAWQNYQRGGNLAARPGTSNHGWGLAIDFRVATVPNNMGTSINSYSSADYIWMKNNAYKYGWVNPLSMREGNCSGSGCEPWHFQYVGPLY